MTRAVGYVRISQLDERTTSPARQRQDIERTCAARGWELVKIYEDLDVSGYAKNGKRPGLDKLLARLDEIEAVVFWKIDRLARGVQKFYGILERCQAANVALVSTAEPFDTSSPMGKAMVGITAIFAELESDVISERARAMHAYLKEQGRWVGRVPYGWRLENGRLAPNKDEIATLTEVARRYVSGESLRSISTNLGLRHTGLSKQLRTDRVLEALPASLAARLVAEMAERGREGTKAKRSLLAGLARCGVCGAGMTIVAQRKAGRRKAWAAYSCKESHTSISQPWLDAFISEQVIAAIDSEKLLKAMRKHRARKTVVPASELEGRLELLDIDFYEKAMMNREAFLRRREGILKRLKTARDAQEERGIDLPAGLARGLSEKWPGLDTATRRRIIGVVIESVTVSKAQGHGPIDERRVRIVWR